MSWREKDWETHSQKEKERKKTGRYFAEWKIDDTSQKWRCYHARHEIENVNEDRDKEELGEWVSEERCR